MTDKLHVFISYKKLPGSITPPYAMNIATRLAKDYGFSVFIDIEKMQTGDVWAQRIYDEIHMADVLVLLLEPNTATSEWVQREVDFARGANVSIVPLLMVDRGEVDINEAIKRLALATIQHSPHFREQAEDYERLAKDIRRLAIDTRLAQRRQHRQREQHWFSLPTEALRYKARVYQMHDGRLPALQICLTVGNVLDMQPGSIDVIVNSENDFLQMARFYEANTLSARLRLAGALFDDDGRMVEDTVQQDLIADGKVLPVPLRQVIIKRAGHERGALRAEHQIKLILHAITVQYDIGDMMQPVKTFASESAFQEVIERCLRAINTVNGDKALRESVDPRFDEVRTVALPMFGAGMGGRSIKEIAPAMIKGLHKALSKLGAYSLRELHLLVYNPHDVGPVQEALDATFEQVK
jgi:O-acetyl-ADP-ribose deacetylase (regulator of RNase III)